MTETVAPVASELRTQVDKAVHVVREAVGI